MQRCRPLNKTNQMWILRGIDLCGLPRDGNLKMEDQKSAWTGQGQPEGSVRLYFNRLHTVHPVELDAFLCDFKLMSYLKVSFKLLRAPTNCSFFQLQRLKRSLSFKSVMRSKSVDNFFQRSNGETRPPSALITTPPPLPSPPPFTESPLAYQRSPSLTPSISPNPSLSSHSPAISPSLSITFKTNQPKSQALPVQPVKTHCFQEHVFRRPTCCQQCKHMIQGRSAVPDTCTHGSYAAMLMNKLLVACE